MWGKGGKKKNSKDDKRDSGNVGTGMCLSDHYIEHRHHFFMHALPDPPSPP